MIAEAPAYDRARALVGEATTVLDRTGEVRAPREPAAECRLIPAPW
jgi:hypothetical protein